MTQDQLQHFEAIQFLLSEVAFLKNENSLKTASLVTAINTVSLAQKRIEQLELAAALNRYIKPKSKGGRPTKKITDAGWFELVEVVLAMMPSRNAPRHTASAAIGHIVRIMESESGQTWTPKERKGCKKTIANYVSKYKLSLKPNA